MNRVDGRRRLVRAFSQEALRSLGCGALGAATAITVLRVVPLGGDAAAHLYRTLLVQHGVLVWDNLWYGGQYPLGSYSLLYYWPAALFGNTWVVVCAIAVSSGLFASIIGREWGGLGWTPGLVFAAAAGVVPATGEYPFLLGIAAALATLALLQRHRPIQAGVLAASPSAAAHWRSCSW